MAANTLQVRIAFQPWLARYLDNLTRFCRETGAQPDKEALRGVMARGITLIPEQRAGTAQPPGGPTTP